VDGRPLGTFEAGRYTELAIAVVAGRPVVLTVGDYDPRFVRDPETGACLWRLPVDDATSVTVCHPGGRPTAVTGHEDGTTRLWDLARQCATGPVLTGHDQAVRAVAAGVVDGRPLAATSSGMDADQSWDRDVLVHDLTDGRRLARLPAASTTAVNALALTTVHGRAVVATGDWRGTLRTWDVRSGTETGPAPTPHRGMFGALAAGEWAGRPVLASGGDDGTVRLTDLATRTPPAPDLRLPGRPAGIAVLPGRRLLAAHDHGLVLLAHHPGP
jgi:WD40 repeat protein